MDTPIIKITAEAPSLSIAMEAYRDLMTGPQPSCDKDFRRAVMLAVLIGRQIESAYRDSR